MDVVNLLLKFSEKKGLCLSSGVFVLDDPSIKIYTSLKSRKNVFKTVSSHSIYFETSSVPLQSYRIDIKPFDTLCNTKFINQKIKRTFNSLTFFNFSSPHPVSKKTKYFTFVKLEASGSPKPVDVYVHSINFVKTRLDCDDHILEIRKHIPECTNKNQFEYTAFFRRGFEVFIPKSDFIRLCK